MKYILCSQKNMRFILTHFFVTFYLRILPKHYSRFNVNNRHNNTDYFTYFPDFRKNSRKTVRAL